MRALCVVMLLIGSTVQLTACQATRPYLYSGPCGAATIGGGAWEHPTPEVDVLLVLDAAPVSRPGVARFNAALPAFVRALTTGDHDGDGERDTVAIQSLHLAAVTGDLGAGPHDGVPGCRRGLGDSAVLRSSSTSSRPECAPSYPSAVFAFERLAPDVDETLTALRCVVDLEGSGCSYSQPLEAALRALSTGATHAWNRPGYVPPRFPDAEGVPDAEPGHACFGDEACANEGFLRPHSLLVVIVVTAQDDCSLGDYALVDPADPRLAGVPMGLRCARSAEAGLLQPISRFVDGLQGLRPYPQRLIVDVIAGVPGDLIGRGPFAPDERQVLADPRMRQRSTASGDAVSPSCVSPDGDTATPPVRLIEALRDLRVSGQITQFDSICDASFDGALERVRTWLLDYAGGTCRPLPTAPAPRQIGECQLTESLSSESESRCDALAGREHLEWFLDGGELRERCLVAEVAPGDESQPGWYFDSLPDCPFWGARPIVLTTSLARTGMSDFHMLCSTHDHREVRCDEDNVADTPSQCSVGMWCVPGERDRCSTGWSGAANTGVRLRCDVVNRACAIPCASDGDCRAAGAVDHVCDLRTNAEATGYWYELAEPFASAVRGTCVGPECYESLDPPEP